MKNTSEYNHSYYESRKEELKKRVKSKAEKRRDAVRTAKDKPCADCGVKYGYWIMQFDHVRGEKKFNIGYMWYKKGLQAILQEIEKCDVVCANCHANRTFQRKKALSSTG